MYTITVLGKPSSFCPISKFKPRPLDFVQHRILQEEWSNIPMYAKQVAVLFFVLGRKIQI